MKRPSTRAVRLATWLTIPAALIASGLVIGGASYSAFSSTTSNATNNWTTGTVNLTDDDGTAALFTATNLKPGSTGTKCITVTSTGSLTAPVKLYGTTPTTTNALNTYINLSITQGTGGSFGSCTGYTPLSTGSSVYSGTLASFGTTYTNYANGAGNWVTTGAASEPRTFQFTYTVDAAAPNSVQNSTASIGFTWEAQNN
jgi:hypothetical protein